MTLDGGKRPLLAPAKLALATVTALSGVKGMPPTFPAGPVPLVARSFWLPGLSGSSSEVQKSRSSSTWK